MSQTMKNTEWKAVPLTKARLDFTGATKASLECDGNSFISLTMHLRNGQTVRIRKENYGVTIEAPVIQMETKYLVKTEAGLTATFDTEDKALQALGDQKGDVSEIQVPVQDGEQKATAVLTHDDLPF